MSAPMNLDSDQLKRIAGFLDAISAATSAHDISLDAYGPAHLHVDDNVIRFSWSREAARYVVADRVGD